MNDDTQNITLKPRAVTRVFLAANTCSGLRAIADALTPPRYSIVAEMSGLARLSDTVEALLPDVVVTDLAQCAEMDLARICAVSRRLPRTFVVLTDDTRAESMREATEAGVSSYVIGAVAPERLTHIVEVAVARFEAVHALRTELDHARTSLVERKIVERAKGIVMKQRGCDEASAFAILRKQAMTRNTKLADIARSIVTAAEVLA